MLPIVLVFPVDDYHFTKKNYHQFGGNGIVVHINERKTKNH
jgi:hypothetical protein